MAWLNAVPKPDPRSKRAENADAAPAVSRIAAMKASGVTPVMPPNPAPHIVERLIEIGLTEATGTGVGPLGWPTIDAWQRVSGVDLPPWEARLIRSLSVAYVAESRAAESENCPAPWLAPATEASISAELRVLDEVLG